MTKSTPSEFLHKTPVDLKEMLGSNSKSESTWKDITALARNEWICWITSAKKQETRDERLERARIQLAEGKRRPCCWPGCPHRRPSAKKWFK